MLCSALYSRIVSCCALVYIVVLCCDLWSGIVLRCNVFVCTVLSAIVLCWFYVYAIVTSRVCLCCLCYMVLSRLAEHRLTLHGFVLYCVRLSCDLGVVSSLLFGVMCCCVVLYCLVLHCMKLYCIGLCSLMFG